MKCCNVNSSIRLNVLLQKKLFHRIGSTNKMTVNFSKDPVWGTQTVMDDFQPSNFCGLGIRVRVWVMVRAWVIVTVRVMVGFRVSLLLRSG